VTPCLRIAPRFVAGIDTTSYSARLPYLRSDLAVSCASNQAQPETHRWERMAASAETARKLIPRLATLRPRELLGHIGALGQVSSVCSARS